MSEKRKNCVEISTRLVTTTTAALINISLHHRSCLIPYTYLHLDLWVPFLLQQLKIFVFFMNDN